MQLIERDIFYKSKSDEFDLVPIGDIHLGNVGCDIEHLKKIITYIKDNPKALWIGMGDYMECINIIDPRFDAKSIDPSYDIKNVDNLVSMQMADIKALFMPIKNKCLGLITGNHEETIRIRFKRDVTLDLTREMGVDYLGYDCFLRMNFIRKPLLIKATGTTIILYATHGCGGSRMAGGKINRIESFCDSFDADIVLVAHEHKKIVTNKIKIGIKKIDTLKLVHKKQVGCMTGSFLQGYVNDAMTYVERKGYPPTDIGVVKVMIKPFTRDIHASM